MSPARGFSLPEMMAVVAVTGVLASVAARFGSRSDAERVPATARALVAMANEARHAALSLQQPVRIRLSAGDAVSETLDPTDGKTWRPLSHVVVPRTAALCTADPFVNLSSAAPVCPTAPSTLCFQPNGRAALANADCATVPPAGATLYLRGVGASQRFKLMVYGLTSLCRLADRW